MLAVVALGLTAAAASVAADPTFPANIGSKTYQFGYSRGNWKQLAITFGYRPRGWSNTQNVQKYGFKIRTTLFNGYLPPSGFGGTKPIPAASKYVCTNHPTATTWWCVYVLSTNGGADFSNLAILTKIKGGFFEMGESESGEHFDWQPNPLLLHIAESVSGSIVPIYGGPSVTSGPHS